MTIHDTHPFADPTPDPARRLRGRLGGTVTLWTAGEGRDRAGLTVTSLMLAAGETPRLLTLLDPDADLTETLVSTGRGVVQLLTWEHRDLAEAFAGTAPAPGGPFRQAEFEQTVAGPWLVGTTRATVTVESVVEVGWSSLVTSVLEDVVVADDEGTPLGHRRGRFFRLDG